jgi:hypothetical protein
MPEQSGKEAESYIVEATNPRGGTFGDVLISATSKEEAVDKFDDYSGYIVQVRHETGGTTNETVFAENEKEARQKAFEREISYVETLDIDKFTMDYGTNAIKEKERYD